LNPDAQKQMIHWTLILVLALGALNLLFMFQQPERVQNPIRKSSGSSRTPASAGEIANVEIPVSDHPQLTSATELTVDCNPQTHPSVLPANIKYARISGTICPRPGRHRSGGSRVTEIKNLANGFAATVFNLSEREFTTDYISLMDGENHIQISHRYDDGAVESLEFLAKRQSSSPAEKKPANH
jgi:hypothetical protein